MKPVSVELISQRWTQARAALPDKKINRALYECLQEAILDGSLTACARLPATRELAHELKVSRNSVSHAYEQLSAEGYLRGLTGSGTFVCDVLPEHVLWSHGRQDRKPQSFLTESASRPLANRGVNLINRARASSIQWGAFMPGVPDVREFPHRKFQKLIARHSRQPPPNWLSYSSGGGHPGLKQALADHLRQARSIQCEPEQLLITEGIHQAVDLVSRMLADVGDSVWMEEPGYWGIRNIVEMNGLQVQGITVDADGMRLPKVQPPKPPRLIFVTPSHQYPLGSVMSLSRRLALIEYARRNGSWIVEDDYDSEFRFSGHPISSLQGLNAHAPIIYIGTFSKTLYPGLRIAYLVLPKALVEAFRCAHAELYREGHFVTQAALASFIEEGAYAAHIRRMRLIYAQRREALSSVVSTRLGSEFLHPFNSNAGLHLTLSLRDSYDDVEVTRQALQQGVLVRPLSSYYQGKKTTRGLLLGFACVAEEEMLAPFERLVYCINAGC